LEPLFNLKTVRGDIMTKAELIEKMAKDAGITKAAAGKAYESFLDGLEGKFPTAFHGVGDRINSWYVDG
jgi:hypothetical protein